MANKKLCLKDYLICQDDSTLSKTRKKMNKKSHKGRHYGMDHGYTVGDGGDGGAMGESINEMHNGIIPDTYSPNVLKNQPTVSGTEDMKRQNRRNAPRKRSFAQFLQLRNAAEEEETIEPSEWDLAFQDAPGKDVDREQDQWDLDPYADAPFQDAASPENEEEFDDFEDEPMNDFDSFERNAERGRDVDDFMSGRYGNMSDEEIDAQMSSELGLEDDPELEPEESDDFSFINSLRDVAGYGVEGSTPAGNDYGDMFDEEEEDLEDDFEDESYGEERDSFDDDEYGEEYDDLDPESELNFDDEEGISDEDIEDIAATTGRFTDFYRDTSEDMPDTTDEFGDEFEEEEEPVQQEIGVGPGGFEPGAAVGADATSGSQNATKIDRAKILFQQLINRPGISRKDIIQQFEEQLDTTNSTAVSYYERIAKEMGLTNADEEDQFGAAGGPGEDEMYDEMGAGEEAFAPEVDQDEIDQQPPDRQGIIRRVDNAHLVYKRQMEDGGFEELWSYNIGEELDDALKTRRAILAGTDIPRGHTRSEDGQQAYTLTTMGNAQMLHITGLSN